MSSECVGHPGIGNNSSPILINKAVKVMNIPRMASGGVGDKMCCY